MTIKKSSDVEIAARRAAEYLNALMPQAEAIQLEEVEKITDRSKNHWLITLSFQPNLSGSGLRGLQMAMGKREYKTFTIDANTGEVISMKIKTF